MAFNSASAIINIIDIACLMFVSLGLSVLSFPGPGPGWTTMNKQ